MNVCVCVCACGPFPSALKDFLGSFAGHGQMPMYEFSDVLKTRRRAQLRSGKSLKPEALTAKDLY